MHVLRLIALALIFTAHVARSAGTAEEAIREAAAKLPLLELGTAAGSPKFQVVRLNTPPIVFANARYGAVRVVCPADKPMDLAWMFADVTNIDEYQCIPAKGSAIGDGTLWTICKPTASFEQEELRGRTRSALPRPWDFFELHMSVVPASLLTPGAEYIIWFKFSDERPTDVLLAATFVAPNPQLKASDLPPIFALPAEISR